MYLLHCWGTSHGGPSEDRIEFIIGVSDEVGGCPTLTCEDHPILTNEKFDHDPAKGDVGQDFNHSLETKSHLLPASHRHNMGESIGAVDGGIHTAARIVNDEFEGIEFRQVQLSEQAVLHAVHAVQNRYGGVIRARRGVLKVEKTCASYRCTSSGVVK